MGMTMTQKILADHAGLDKVSPGQLIKAKLDMVLGNDITTPVAVKEFRKIGVNKVFDVNKIAIVPDHFTPNKDIKSAEQVKFIREFAREMGIVNFFEVGFLLQGQVALHHFSNSFFLIKCWYDHSNSLFSFIFPLSYPFLVEGSFRKCIAYENCCGVLCFHSVVGAVLVSACAVEPK